MKIQLQNWKVQRLSFELLGENQKREESSFGIKKGQIFPGEDKKSFVIVFEIDLKDKDFDLNFESAFVFSLDDEITEEFKFSDFPKINAPAIAFPYLRAYISNLTLQSGFEPRILPSINFVNLAKEDN